MPNRYKTGMYGQRLAEEYLTARRWTILYRNYRTRAGEIDLIARDGEYTVFLEVKYRRSLAFGEPPEAVTAGKRAALRCAAQEYVRENFPEDGDLPFPDCRFDVIAVYDPPGGQRTVEHLADAF
ncbi:MAG: YraN family protein [Firmicutes bacterium]|nr:YraN family protein [Bacillota bacterium]